MSTSSWGKDLSGSEKIVINEHTIFQYHPKFESEHEVEIESKIRQDILRNCCNITARKTVIYPATKLAIKLANCTEDEPCNSLACPKCVRLQRLHFIETTVNALWEIQDELVFVTYIPYQQELNNTNPALIDIPSIKDKFRCYLKNTGIEQIAIGCVEMDYDLNSSSWVPHIHFLTKEIDKNKLKTLRGKINTNHLKTREGVKNRPLHVKKIDFFISLIAYIYKFMWQAKLIKKNRGFKQKKVRLADDTAIYSYLLLDQYSMKDMEFRYGVRRNKNGLSFTHSAE